MSILSSIDAGIGRITLNRPAQLNAVTAELARRLSRAVTDLGADADVSVLLLRGAGGNFCAGGDFTEVQRLRDAGEAALTGLFSAFRAACDAIAAVEVPVVVAVEGVAAAGGFELMQAADIVLVSDQARIADNHVNFGMVPGGGSTARLPRLVGRQQALGLLLSGDRICGAQAVARGLAYRSYPPDEFDTAVEQFVAALARRSRPAVRTIKRLVYDNLDRPLGAALDAEQDAVIRHLVGAAGADAVQRFAHRRTEVGR